MLTVLTTENTLSAPINAEYRVMSPVSLVPEQDLHFVVTSVGPASPMSRLTRPKQMHPPSCAISYRGNTIDPFEFWR
jgi:hypothetical protein